LNDLEQPRVSTYLTLDLSSSRVKDTLDHTLLCCQRAVALLPRSCRCSSNLVVYCRSNSFLLYQPFCLHRLYPGAYRLSWQPVIVHPQNAPEPFQSVLSLFYASRRKGYFPLATHEGWTATIVSQDLTLYTKCNSPLINGQCTNFVLFDLALGL